MPAPFDGRPFVLPRNHLVTIPDAAGLRIACLRGCIWLTVDHEERDIVLEPGDSYVAAQHRAVICHALEASCLTAQDDRTAAERIRAGSQGAARHRAARLFAGAVARLVGDNRAHERTREVPASAA